MTTTTELSRLQGKIVLVKSSRDRRTPASAMRGSIEVHENPGRQPEISIAVEFPQMFTLPAHHRVIPLGPEGIERLIASERDGTFEFTITDELGGSD